jgi:hypothetical protein
MSTRTKTRRPSTAISLRRRKAGALTALPRRRSASTIRLEKPHSLSYQEKTFTTRSPETMVNGASKIEECGLPMMSHETMGSSLYWRMPFKGPSAASRIASFTLWTLAGLGHVPP